MSLGQASPKWVVPDHPESEGKMKYIATKDFLLHGVVIESGEEIELEENDHDARLLLHMGRIAESMRIATNNDDSSVKKGRRK